MNSTSHQAGPTFSSDLYSFATLAMERKAENRIDNAIDKDGLARWFGDQLRGAYAAGLRDGYVQGIHDRHTGGGSDGSPDS